MMKKHVWQFSKIRETQSGRCWSCFSTTAGNIHGGQQWHEPPPSQFHSQIALFTPALSSGSALRSPCISVSRLSNSLQTFTHSQLLQLLLCCSLSLISQGSAPGCLLLLLAAYFARGLFPYVSSGLLRLSPAPSTSLHAGVPPAPLSLVQDSVSSSPSWFAPAFWYLSEGTRGWEAVVVMAGREGCHLYWIRKVWLVAWPEGSCCLERSVLLGYLAVSGESADKRRKWRELRHLFWNGLDWRSPQKPTS